MLALAARQAGLAQQFAQARAHDGRFHQHRRIAARTRRRKQQHEPAVQRGVAEHGDRLAQRLDLAARAEAGRVDEAQQLVDERRVTLEHGLDLGHVLVVLHHLHQLQDDGLRRIHALDGVAGARRQVQLADERIQAERGAGVEIGPRRHRTPDEAQRRLPGGRIGTRLFGDVGAGKAHFCVRRVRRQVLAQQRQVGAAQRDADAAHAQRLYGGTGIGIGKVAHGQRQHGAVRRQRVQRVERQHGGHRVEEQDLVAQEPALLLVHDVSGHEGDEAFQVGAGEIPAFAPLPAQLVADHALFGVEQGFTDDEVGLVHDETIAG